MSIRWVLFLPAIAVFGLLGLFGYVFWKDIDVRDVPSAREGKPMPEFRLTAVDDAQTVLTRGSLDGEPYLMNFWATWCPSCKFEHPYLNSLASEGVRIIGVNYKDERDLALTWLADYANPYEIDIYDPNGDLGFELGVTGAPETFFVDSSGVIQHRYQGPIDAAVWDNKLKAIYDAME